ncbi:MAG: DUF1491 family protein [Boseongicola sp.]|nr:DUF1491 family protein [Boseongicola sp.]MDE0344761.1 DUF1491 family protein [Boseongicola sp.]MXW86294.1 DUF1491 family protein [Boseongicola sp. SB0667_bin_21]MYI69243.1 DUF1491 family protein [Boseongicola sp. SB0673_bin_14]
MTRLTSEIWIAAYLTRLRQAAIPAFIVRKGDATAGAVLVKLNTLDGSATCFQRSFDLVSGERQWVVLAEGPEAEVDRKVSRQREFDPDIWVVEVEDRTGRHMLDEPGLT